MVMSKSPTLVCFDFQVVWNEYTQLFCGSEQQLCQQADSAAACECRLEACGVPVSVVQDTGIR